MRRLLSERDGPPASVIEAARAAFGWRELDEQLAILVGDTLDASTPAGVRSSQQPRMLDFAHGDRGVEVQVEESGEVRRLVGQCIPTGTGIVELRSGGTGEVITVELDDLGRFDADGVPRGPVSIRCVPAEGEPFTTVWVTV